VSAASQLATEADRAALAQVLSGPDFQAARWRGEGLLRWLRQAWERLTELLGTSEAEQVAGLGRVVFLTAVAVAALLLWRAARQRRSRRPPALGATPVLVRTLAEPRVTVAEGERALAAGELAEAVRLAFLAAVGGLRRRVDGRAIETLTGPELASHLADDGFARLVRLHERTVFGQRPVSIEEASAALAVASGLASGPDLAGVVAP
jgi:hypothetical protein